jgi:hypothetical protein
MSHEDAKLEVLTYNFEENILSTNEKENYVQYKDKYRKLSKMVEMFGNKIRKI